MFSSSGKADDDALLIRKSEEFSQAFKFSPTRNDLPAYESSFERQSILDIFLGSQKVCIRGKGENDSHTHTKKSAT